MYIYICLSLSLSIYLYIYIYIYMSMSIYIYIYICIYSPKVAYIRQKDSICSQGSMPASLDEGALYPVGAVQKRWLPNRLSVSWVNEIKW